MNNINSIAYNMIISLLIYYAYKYVYFTDIDIIFLISSNYKGQ